MVKRPRRAIALGSRAQDLLGSRLKQILWSGQPTQLQSSAHEATTRGRWRLRGRAAGRSQQTRLLSLVMICTSNTFQQRTQSAFLKKSTHEILRPVSFGRILGEMPPLRKIPPVAMVLRARLPASAP
jgi:hypothetical protein